MEVFPPPDNTLLDDIPQCCCGQRDCAFLTHSCRLLDDVRRDARTAGELGQALLARHENYVADSERERLCMLECISHLEAEKTALESSNKSAIDENRKLLDQLEALNTAVIESDARILSLTDALRSADQNVEKLTALAARTERLQEQLQRFELEQEKLHATLALTKEDERTAILRWQKAERTINDLQDQLDRIEREAREESERHAEVVTRMERRRAVEMELQTAAGRLKGAAAAKSVAPEANGNKDVVSHFVKDILQDNANLQMGIVELKEMLDQSNEEVERLRQIMAQNDGHQSPPRSSTPNLGTELNAKELHVHHHYHAPTQKTEPLRTPRREFQRRPKKKRANPSLGGFIPQVHTPRSSISSMHSPTASAIISQTSVSIPPQARGTKRWSVQSNQTGSSTFSSLPSSPYGESVFDRVFSDIATDISRPTSPESEAFSPRDFDGSHARKDSVPPFTLDEGMRTSSEGAVPLGRQITASKGKGRLDSPLLEYDSWQTNQSVIFEEDEDAHNRDGAESPDTVLDSPDEQPKASMPPLHTSPPRDIPRLRRAASHESIISVHGADIHTLQSRPSQLLIGTPGTRRMFSAGSPAAVSGASQPTVSDTSAVSTVHAARPSAAGNRVDSREYLSSLASARTLSRKPSSNAPLSKKSSMGQLGSWVMGRWGYSASPSFPTPPPPPAPATLTIPPPPPPPNKTTSTLTPETASISSSTSGSTLSSAAALKTPLKSNPLPILLRTPGINQPGPILGFGPETPLPRTVVRSRVDEEALRESLGRG